MTQLKIGDQFKSRYLIKGILGKGGMGIVYDAFDQVKRNPCAIKLLLHHRKESEQYRRRLATEIEIMSRLSHPNIVEVYDFYKGSTVATSDLLQESESHITPLSSDEVPYLVMERLEGYNLATLLKTSNQLTLDDALTIIQQTLSAITHAHEQGIIHRDLKPENLFIVQNSSTNLHLKVLDFGVAKDLESNISLTASLDFPMIGTPHYMAPEQIKNQKVAASCDLYSMGVIIYEILNAHPPFAMSSLKVPSELNILPASLRLTWLHIHTPPPPLDFEVEFDEIIKQTLAKAPQDRPQSAKDLSQLLYRWAEKNEPLLNLALPLDKNYNKQKIERMLTLASLTTEAISEAAKTIKLSIPIDPRILDINPPEAVTRKFYISDIWPQIDEHTTPKPKLGSSNRIAWPAQLIDELRKGSQDGVQQIEIDDLQDSDQDTHHRLKTPFKLMFSLVLFISLSLASFYFVSPEANRNNSKQSQTSPLNKARISSDHQRTMRFTSTFQSLKDLQDLIADLHNVTPQLSKALPHHITQDVLKRAINWIEDYAIIKGIKELSEYQVKLYQAYLYTWQGLEDSSKFALIKLYEIKTHQLATHQEQHIYALTLMRVNLQASASLRIKLAIKHFQIADRLFFVMQTSKRNEADHRDFYTRLKIYQQIGEWSLLESALKHLEHERKLSPELSSLLFKAQEHIKFMTSSSTSKDKGN